VLKRNSEKERRINRLEHNIIFDAFDAFVLPNFIISSTGEHKTERYYLNKAACIQKNIS